MSTHKKISIAVIGTGHTKFGELWDKSLQDLLAESQIEALTEAQITPQDIDYIATGNMCGQSLSSQAHVGVLASDILNTNVPSIRVESACGSGAYALHTGIQALLSGMYQVVLVNGVEKMTDLPIHDITSSLIQASLHETEQFAGATYPGLMALVARMYLEKYKISREQLAHVSIKNHKNGTLNPLAHLRKEISLEHVLSAPIVADPLTLLDCAPISDGAASLVLCTQEYAEKRGYTQRPNTHNKHSEKYNSPVYITASSIATDRISLSNREDLLDFKATRAAAQAAYDQANITPQDIDIIELHDAFSIAEPMTLEALGFFEPGTACAAIAAGKTNIGSKLPVNPSGGLKSRGHPVGATGIAQAVDVVRQLQNRYENEKTDNARQVKNPKIALTHNMGGIGTSVAIHIFSKE